MGYGPYWGTPIPMMSWSHVTRSHPTPDEEGIDCSSDFFCGFPTLSHLKTWFYRWRTRLREEGFKLTVWDVPNEHVRLGIKQLVFKKDEARLIKTVRIP